MESNLTNYLTCPICIEISIEPVESECCHNIFCKKCAGSLKQNQCPQCRKQPFNFILSVLAKRMVESLPAVCTHCQLHTSIGDLKSHEVNCEKRLRKCGIGNCEFEGIVSDFIAHLSETHQKELINKYEKSGITPTTKPEEEQELPQSVLINDANLLFIDPIKAIKINNRTARLGESSKYYCRGKLEGNCNCCDGNCGPTSGCNCRSCMDLDIKSRRLPKGYWVNCTGGICHKFKGKMYCGRKVLPKGIFCDGYCGPDNGPNCKDCQLLDSQLNIRYAKLNQ